MNRLLTILLLASGTAYGQINNPPTSVNIVDSTATGRAVLTATNAAAAATAIGLGWSALTNPQSSLYSGTATQLLGYVAETNPSGSGLTGFNVMAYTNTNTLVIPANLLIAEDAVPAARNARNVTVNGAVTIQYPYSSPTTIYGNNSILATDASTYTNTLATWNSNTVTFATNVSVAGTLAVSNTATFSTNVTVNGNISVGSLTTTTPSTWALDATQTAADTNGVLALPSNANVIRLTNSTAISGVSGGVLGAFYYLVNQTTNAVTISNVGGITIQGGTSLTLGANQAATLVATGSTNASVAARGDLNDVTLGGTLNKAPLQTADSADSLMTRDLVGQEFANPRNKMQTTYWFGLEGLGLWQLVNGGASFAANRGAKFGPSLAFYTGTRSSANAAGLGLRLGATAISGGSMWRPLDGGAFTARTHVVNYFSAASTGNRAFGFSFAAGANTNFWGSPDSFGLFWVQQPTNTWAASTAFTANDRIAVSNVVWAVATAGTTDTNEPVWTDLINSTVTNGTAVFRNLGPHTSNNWVLAIGHTNASGVVMTNTGKSNWLRATGGSGHEVLLTLRYGTNTAAPFTVYGSVGDGTGQGAEVTLNLPTNNAQVSPQYWLRYDSTNSSGANDVAGIRYFSIDAELPPLD